jgi:LCP family protein required for cell wall assembly
MATVIVVILIIGVQIKAQQTGESDSAGSESSYEPVQQEENREDTDTAPQFAEKWQEGTICYDDKYYTYNNNLSTYLLMGIDCNDAIYNMDTKETGYQSDAMFLLVADNDTQELSVVSINRNTMAEISVFTSGGVSMGSIVSQLCVQHAYGDGKKLSCSRTLEAVENLFYQIPIKGYVSINMGGIPGLNDAVGGIEVDVLHDITYPDVGVDLREGERVTLNGQEAYCYLRGRDVTEYDSATARLRRQEQYITAYLDKLHAAEDQTQMILDIYEAVDDYIVTNIDITDWLGRFLVYDFSDENVYTVPGEIQTGDDGLEEYHVDEDAFYELILQVFYEEVTL